MARSHWKSVRRSSRPARMASNEYARSASGAGYASGAYSRALGYVAPFGVSTMFMGAWNQYTYQKTYGVRAKHVAPWGAYSLARRGGYSIAPRDVSRYYR